MPLQSNVGQFAAPISTNSIVISCPFAGKAIILFTHGKTANAESAGASWSVGFSDGTNHHCSSWAGDDAVSTTNVGRSNRSTRSLEILTNGTPTVGTGGGINGISFGPTSFTVTFSATPASAWLIGYVLFGGTDITNIFVGSAAGPTTTGSFSVTNVGFQGNFVLLLTNQQSSVGTTTGMSSSIGCAVSGTQRWAYGQTVQDAQTLSANVNGRSIMRSVALVGQNAAASVTMSADFTQWTATGFDLNFATAPGASPLLHYLVIKGGQWDCGVSAKPTTATTQTVTGEVFTPTVLGLFVSSPTAVNANTALSVSSFGAADGTNQCYAEANHNDAIPTVANSAGDAANLLLDRDGTNNPVASFISFNSDGWTATWNATGTAKLVGWFTAGNNLAQSSIAVATTTTYYVGIFSKDLNLYGGSYDPGIPIQYGLYDDDFVAKFSGTAFSILTQVASVPYGVFDRDATLLGLYGAT